MKPDHIDLNTLGGPLADAVARDRHKAAGSAQAGAVQMQLVLDWRLKGGFRFEQPPIRGVLWTRAAAFP